jgi:type IV pilus assembly protein PilQ
MKKTTPLITVLLILPALSRSQDTTKAQILQPIQRDSVKIPEKQVQVPKIDLIEVKNADLKDVIRGIAAKYNLNILIDDAVQQRVTLRLADIPVPEVLAFIARENGLNLIHEGTIYKITYPEIIKPVPKPPAVDCVDGLLSVDLKNEDADRVVSAVCEASKRSIILGQGADGKVSGFLKDVPFEKGFTTLMSSNGFNVRVKDNIFIVEKEASGMKGELRRGGRALRVERKDSLFSMDVSDADLGSLVRELSDQSGANVVMTGDLTGKVNVQCEAATLEEALGYAFQGTNYTFRKADGVYILGDRKDPGLSTTRLVRLNYIKAEDAEKMIRETRNDFVALQIVEEHNGIMVKGAQDDVAEVEDFIRQIDYPIPQILIEAVVVDFNSSDIGAFGVTAGFTSSGDTSSVLDSGTIFPAVDIQASSSLLNDGIKYYSPRLGIKNIGKLPDNFYMNLKALETRGKANIRSRPQIATLNGKTASIKIGTTQYYQLDSYMPIVGGNTAFQQTTQRFEQIKAEISLEITPWVSASGEITTIIKPEFSTPRQFDSKTPPTIDYRTLESTVRLRDGETIILGGMTKDIDEETVNKLPVLGEMPVLGRLFQSRSHNRSKATLMIYITPHLMYTDNPAFRYRETEP